MFTKWPETVICTEVRLDSWPKTLLIFLLYFGFKNSKKTTRLIFIFIVQKANLYLVEKLNTFYE